MAALFVRVNGLLAQTALLLLQEIFQLLIPDGEALGVALLVRGAGLRGGLFGDLADILAHDRDAVRKLGG